MSDSRQALPIAPAASPPAGFWYTTFSSLVVPAFRVLTIGNTFSMAAMQMGLVARAWLAFELSGSATTLGLVALATGLPQLLCSIVSGVVADRMDKRTLMIVTQLTLSTVAATNAVLVHLAVIEVWHLVLLGALQGTAFALNVPARLGFMPELVGKEHLSNAIALNSTVVNVNRVLGPGIVGLLLAWNPDIAFYCIAFFYVAAAVTLFGLPHSTIVPASGKAALAEVIYGFQYIWEKHLLRTLMSLAFIPALLGLPFQQVLPVFQVIFAVGPSELGFMNTAFGVGSLAGSLLIARIAMYPRKGAIQMIGGVAFGISLFSFALSPTYVISLPLLVIAGVACQSFLTINSVLITLETDRKMYSRVMAIYMINWSLMPMFTLPMGAVVDLVGARRTVGSAGLLIAGCVLLIVALLPSLWRSNQKTMEAEAG